MHYFILLTLIFTSLSEVTKMISDTACVMNA